MNDVVDTGKTFRGYRIYLECTDSPAHDLRVVDGFRHFVDNLHTRKSASYYQNKAKEFLHEGEEIR